MKWRTAATPKQMHVHINRGRVGSCNAWHSDVELVNDASLERNVLQPYLTLFPQLCLCLQVQLTLLQLGTLQLVSSCAFPTLMPAWVSRLVSTSLIGDMDSVAVV